MVGGTQTNHLTEKINSSFCYQKQPTNNMNSMVSHLVLVLSLCSSNSFASFIHQGFYEVDLQFLLAFFMWCLTFIVTYKFPPCTKFWLCPDAANARLKQMLYVSTVSKFQSKSVFQARPGFFFPTKRHREGFFFA